MPEMQPSVPGPQAAIPVLAEMPAAMTEEPDFALGCECADPALQIAMWGQEARSEGA
ncbi:hypothetical protein [Ramlibacter alkalitolerans]|jgi:hypothetical protein|uniref:Uncharacterized protein n=1 Tax=Ramlibacter alkalitolerans TaxID=2039631 RepID=A0ABS1JVB7_9BURK|nr:hypothetical protein [Ramlibacter alkalitolerans]MBL0428258.1 hypothetical protein [Ramlibacter alkalitolerans]